jgi:hypothetical protein
MKTKTQYYYEVKCSDPYDGPYTLEAESDEQAVEILLKRRPIWKIMALYRINNGEIIIINFKR